MGNDISPKGCSVDIGQANGELRQSDCGTGRIIMDLVANRGLGAVQTLSLYASCGFRGTDACDCHDVPFAEFGAPDAS
jgi:hypothetical protein